MVYNITLYTKPECHLCDDARAILDTIFAEAQDTAHFELREVDIRLNEADFALYRYRIPVIIVNGTIAAEGRMDDQARYAIERALAQ